MKPFARRSHRILGLVMLLPICAWAATGLVFFIKPGYDAACGGLRFRTLGLEGASIPEMRPDWLEARMVRTVLGDHLIVRLKGGPTQLDPVTIQPRELPDEAALRRLIEDAISGERERYGDIASIVRTTGDHPAASFETTTGVAIELSWTTLALQQSGRDTRRIDALYRVHYLQWTGIPLLDRTLGIVGLASLTLLAFFGLRLAFANRSSGGEST